MRFLIFLTLVTLTACDPSTGTIPENPDMVLPHCRVIYIGGCKHIWCRSPSGHAGGLASADPTCRPTNANVSDQPVPQCTPTQCPTTKP